MWWSIVFGVLLLVFSVVMLRRHVATWRAARDGKKDERARDFAFRQYRRRMQGSAMIGIIGVAVIAGIWITDNTAALFFWLGVTLVVFWMALLALADLLATRHYYSQLQREQLEEHAALRGELERLKRRDGNGKPPGAAAKPSENG